VATDSHESHPRGKGYEQFFRIAGVVAAAAGTLALAARFCSARRGRCQPPEAPPPRRQLCLKWDTEPCYGAEAITPCAAKVSGREAAGREAVLSVSMHAMTEWARKGAVPALAFLGRDGWYVGVPKGQEFGELSLGDRYAISVPAGLHDTSYVIGAALGEGFCPFPTSVSVVMPAAALDRYAPNVPHL
jgi:hypothetical protein